MTQVDDLQREIKGLRSRLSRLSEATLRINDSLNFDTVLQEVLDSACSLSGARYGLLILLHESGRIRNFLSSGLTPEQTRLIRDLPEGRPLIDYLKTIPGPLRVSDLHGHIRSLGLPEFRPPMPVSDSLSFLAAPVRHGGEVVGSILLGEKEGRRKFSPEDEETLVMFASQAALVIANARRYREEQRARSGLEALINTSPVGVVVFDAKTGEVASINREARRIVGDLHPEGGSAEQLLEALTFRRADGREISLDEFPLAKALSTGETVRAEEIVVQVPDGRSVTTLVNATPIQSEERRVESVVVTLQDMTPVEELERLRSEFLGMVGHELRTPLTSIKGSAATLLEAGPSLDPAEMLQFHRIINEQADYMRDLISDLIDMARIETGTLSVAPSPAEAASLVDEARSTFLSGGSGNDIRVDMAHDLPLVMADRRRILQVLGNLLSNAARYSPEASTIRVHAALDGVHVAIAVTDEGRGVPAERLPHLFRKFTRLDGEERGRDLAGSGLGLAICRGIVEAHGGRIWAESDGPGLGARFTFTIPAVKEAIEVESASGRSSLPPGRAEEGKETILAVDDDPQTLRYVRDALSRAGYTPIVTGDPEDVYRLVKVNRPHLVLLDLMLPGIDGVRLMRGIFEISDVPIMFLSAYGQDEVIARAFEMGAADYVVKPFSPKELVARIRAALRRPTGPVQVEPLPPYVLGDLMVEYGERMVKVAGESVHLTATEYQLLFELSVNGGRVLTHNQLLQRVWGLADSGDGRLVRTVVKRLRRKLGDDASDPDYVFTEPRVGYRMPRNEQPAPPPA